VYEFENRGISEIICNNILKRHEIAPHFKSLGLKLIYLGPGTAGINMQTDPNHATPTGFLHGGMIAALADNAMGLAVVTLGNSCLTVGMNINFIAPVKASEELIAKGQVVSAGKSVVVSEASIFDRKHRLIARSRGTYIKNPNDKFSA